MMMMKGSGRESGDGEIGRTPEQRAGRRGSGAGLRGAADYLGRFLRRSAPQKNVTKKNHFAGTSS